jgi:hypothetical protein
MSDLRTVLSMKERNLIIDLLYKTVVELERDAFGWAWHYAFPPEHYKQYINANYLKEAELCLIRASEAQALINRLTGF